MRIHKEGKVIILLASIVCIILQIFFFIIKTNIIFQVFLLLTASSLIAWILYFFRNPLRVIHQNQKHIIAPADGTVVDIQKVFEEEYYQDYRIKISIFMSPLNVHVNRNPITGVIKYFKYHPGKYLIAFYPKSSTKNERTTIVVAQKDYTILYRQIAGFIARRIKTYVNTHDAVIQGKEFGFIKFGSRMDVYLSLDTHVLVQLNQKVKGGITILAEK